MKEFDTTIQWLTQLKSEINNKDILIKQMNDVLSLVTKMIVDPEFISSPIYQNFKFKYVNNINDIVKIMNKVSIDPVYIASREPEFAKMIDLSAKVRKPKRKTIITADINAPIEFDLYNRRKPTIVKSFQNAKIMSEMINPQSIGGEKEKTNNILNGSKNILNGSKKVIKLPVNGTYYSISLGGVNYFLNFDCMKVCDPEMNIVGSIAGNIIKIDGHDDVVLPIYTDVHPDWDHIHTLYALI